MTKVSETPSVRVLDGAVVGQILSMHTCVGLMRNTMKVVSRREAELPLRWGLPVNGGAMGMMPGSLADPECFGIKLVSLFPGNSALGLSSHMGLMVLFEGQHGQPVALLNGAAITRIRTAAASAAATDALAAQDASRLTILGTGEQARAHLHSMFCVRSFSDVRIWGRSEEKAHAFSAYCKAAGHLATVESDPRRAVAGADVICTTTAASEPIVLGDWLEPGMHLNVVGSSTPNAVEVDTEAVVRSAYFVDYVDSTLAQAGEFQRAMTAGRITQSHIVAEIGEVLLGRDPGRTSTEQITMYRSLGVAAQDLAAAWYVYEEAQKQQLGTVISV